MILPVKVRCEEVAEKNIQEVLTSWSTKLLSKELNQLDNNDGNQCLIYCNGISMIFQIPFAIVQILRSVNIIFRLKQCQINKGLLSILTSMFAVPGTVNITKPEKKTR